MKTLHNNVQMSVHFDASYKLTSRQLAALLRKARPVLLSALFYLLYLMGASPRGISPGPASVAARKAPVPVLFPCAAKQKRRRSATRPAHSQCPGQLRRPGADQSG